MLAEEDIHAARPACTDMLREKQRRNQDSSLFHAWLIATQQSSLRKSESCATAKKQLLNTQLLARMASCATGYNVQKPMVGFRAALPLMSPQRADAS